MVQGSIKSIEKGLVLSRDKINNWFKFGQKKITLQVNNETEFNNIKTISENQKINYVIISDENSLPCILVLGPELEKKIDPITNSLKLY